MGPPNQAQHAADIITDLLRSVQAGGPPGGGRGRGRGQGNWNMGPPGGLQEFTFTVPTVKTGLIIGKGMWLFRFHYQNHSEKYNKLHQNMLNNVYVHLLKVGRQSRASASSLEQGLSYRGIPLLTLIPVSKCSQFVALLSRSTMPDSW